MITPTVGRVVWFYDGYHAAGQQPCAATIAFVHSNRSINIGALDHNGAHFDVQHVLLMQENERPPVAGTPYCEWMPYQLGQAKRTEAAEAAVETLTVPWPPLP